MGSVLGDIARTFRNRAPVPYIGRHSAVTAPPHMGNQAARQLEAMGSVGTLFAIVDMTCEAVAQNPWRLQRVDTSTDPAQTTGDDTPEVVHRHAALSLWERANPFMDGETLRHICQQWYELLGEFIIVPTWGPRGRPSKRGRPRITPGPLELWPVRPDRMTPVPHRTKFLAGWIYTSPDGEKIPLDVDEVIQVRRPNPSDLYRGLSPVVTMLTDIGATEAAAEWQRNFFVNSALPGGVIEFERRLGDTEWEEFTTRWREQHKGVANAHRVATIEGGGKWVDRSFSMRDMQLSELREVPRELIREAMHFPKPMLGTVDDVNRANAEAGEHMFTRWTVDPRLHRWERLANGVLLPMFGAEGSVEFAYESPTIVDADAADRERASKATAAAAYVQAGYHPDDVLETLGIPPMRYVGPPDTGPAEKDDKQQGGQPPNSGKGGGKQKRSSGSSNGHRPADRTVRDMVRDAVLAGAE